MPLPDFKVAAVDSDGNAVSIGAGSFPTGATPLTNSNGNATNAQAQATLAAVVGKTNYITSLTITGGGSTAGAAVLASLAGLKGGTTYYAVVAPVGARVPFPPVVIYFDPPHPANAVNTAITATLPALGAGGLAASVSITGFNI